MPKLTPLQEVKQRFGSKEELANQVLGLVDRDDDVDQEEFERRIHTASNRQLLRMHRVAEIISRRFGSKKALVDAIVGRKFPRGNAGYHAKLSQQRPTQLLDLFQSGPGV